MDFVSVNDGNQRSHDIITETLKRNLPISGHVFGREFVAAYAASGITDTHEAEEKFFTNDLLEAGLWIFLRGGNPETSWNSLPESLKAITEFGAIQQFLPIFALPHIIVPAVIWADFFMTLLCPIWTNESILTLSSIIVSSICDFSIFEFEPIETLSPITIEPICGKWTDPFSEKLNPYPSIPILELDSMVVFLPILVLPKIHVLLKIFVLSPIVTLFPM